MNTAQQKRVLKIVSKDCAIQGKYIDGEGQTCAIGALALEAGVSKKTLRKAGDDGINADLASKHILKIQNALRWAFGLEPDELNDIQTANDNWGSGATSQKERRRNVKVAVKDLVTYEEQV